MTVGRTRHAHAQRRRRLRLGARGRRRGFGRRETAAAAGGAASGARRFPEFASAALEFRKATFLEHHGEVVVGRAVVAVMPASISAGSAGELRLGRRRDRTYRVEGLEGCVVLNAVAPKRSLWGPVSGAFLSNRRRCGVKRCGTLFVEVFYRELLMDGPIARSSRNSTS